MYVANANNLWTVKFIDGTRLYFRSLPSWVRSDESVDYFYRYSYGGAL